MNSGSCSQMMQSCNRVYYFQFYGVKSRIKIINLTDLSKVALKLNIYIEHTFPY